jgi:hypothetical protein
MNSTEYLVFNKLVKYNNNNLIKLWKETENKHIDLELALIREIIMIIFESRDKNSFDKWIMDESVKDRSEFYFKGSDLNE